MRDQGERVVGLFAARGDAEAARERLLAAGLTLVRVEPADAYAGDAGGPTGVSLDVPTGVSLGAGVESDEPGILLAAAPAGSCNAACALATGGAAWRVSAATDGSDEEIERAVQIIKYYGGDV